jgi:formylglycine-generating enzyme required for sulfatase activity
MATYLYLKTAMKTTPLFLLCCSLFTTYVLSNDDGASNACTSACNGDLETETAKDCGCSMTSRIDHSTKKTSTDHEKLKWTTEPHSLQPDHGLKYELMVHLDGGEFFMGTNNPKIVSDGEGPARTVKLSAFYMDQFEVCNHDFGMFVNKTGYVTEVCISLHNIFLK